MTHRELIRRAREVLEEDPRVLAAWLAGSFGRCDADAFSDIDLLAAVHDDERAVFLAEWESILERMAPTVYRNALAPGEVGVYNAITLTLEFLRVLGLLAVVLGRGEVLVAVTGCGQLRSQPKDRGGISPHSPAPPRAAWPRLA